MNDGSGATRELWKRFACRMFPLANSKNTSKIYDLLANFEETVTWERFQDYVQQLETQWKKKPPSEMQPSFRNRMKEDRYPFNIHCFLLLSMFIDFISISLLKSGR
eukprot:UN23728